MLTATDWDKLSCEKTMNNKYKLFHNTFFTHFETVFPKKATKIETYKKPWITNGIRISSQTCKHLASMKVYTRNPEFLKYVNKYTKTYKQVLKTAKRLHNDRLIEHSRNKSKTIWGIINHETARKKI